MTLTVTSSDPEAGLKARRWREKCRRAMQICIIIFRGENETQIEIREPDQSEGFPDFSNLVKKYKMVSYSGSTAESHISLSGHHPLSELEEQIGIALALPRKRLQRVPFPDSVMESDTPEDEQVVIAGFVRRLDEGPNPMLIFSADEYEIITSAVRAASEKQPTSIHFMSAPNNFVDYPLEVRLSQWPKAALEDWNSKRGEYLWEDRFPSDIEIDSGYPVDVICSRPGVSGDQAIIQVDSSNLRGFALLERVQSGWKVVETSEDTDWGLTAWESTLEYFDSLTSVPQCFVPQFEEWSRYPIPFPCPPHTFVEPLSSDESHKVYDAMSRGHSPENELAIPLCTGGSTNLTALLAEARETYEVHLNSEPTELTRSLAEQGVLVVLLNSDASPSLPKLLAYWSREFSLVRVDDTYAVAATATEEGLPRLVSLAAIFESAGLHGLTFGMADSHFPNFYFRPLGSQLARIDHPTPFDHTGEILVSKFYANVRYRSLGRLLEELCLWGDPDSRYTDQIMGAYAAGEF